MTDNQWRMLAILYDCRYRKNGDAAILDWWTSCRARVAGGQLPSDERTVRLTAVALIRSLATKGLAAIEPEKRPSSYGLTEVGLALIRGQLRRDSKVAARRHARRTFAGSARNSPARSGWPLKCAPGIGPVQ